METVSLNVTRYPANMTKFGAQPQDENTVLAETPVHAYGHVALLCTYGSDEIIAEAAKVSYGRRLATLSETPVPKTKPEEVRRLIRYLVRHRHTSPLEQAEATFYLRMPIFVARQLIRHRTANVNEYSARYSELSDDYYIPQPDYIGRQSNTNKQGRGGEPFRDSELAEITNIMMDSQETAMRSYKRLLELGVSRELARIPTSVGVYTEMYWKCDLHNLMHFFKLRTDAHAQQEIRDFAHAMYKCVWPSFPYAFAAWEDYVRDSYTLSAQEITLLGEILKHSDRATLEKPYAMSDREFCDFKFFLDTLLIRRR